MSGYGRFNSGSNNPMTRFISPVIYSCRFLLALLLSLLFSAYVYAASPAGYSEFYIPGDEGNMYYIFDTLDSGTISSSNMHSVITVTAWSDNTIIYYDHWEDGYDFDPANPDASYDRKIVLTSAGDQQIFESPSIPLPTVALTPGTGCSPTASCYYDGGDRIYVAGGSVTVTRASWIEATGVGNQATAWEIYPVKPQLTTYVVPFGEDFGLTYPDFSRVFALVQATEDNTTVTFDFNADSVPDTFCTDTTRATCSPGTQITLSRGQTFLLDNWALSPQSAPYNTVRTGTVIQGDKTLQLKYVAGQVRTPPGWMARGFSAFPRGYWTKDYYAPLDQPTANGNTDYYLYNPNTSSITINWTARSSSGSFSIPALSAVSYLTVTGLSVPTDSGLYFSGSDVFWGVGVGDAGNYIREWGFSLLPSTMLYDEHFLGWAPGGIPTTPPLPAGDYDDSGIFITVAQDNTRVFIDRDNDGTADLTYTLDRLQTQFVYDATDGDLSRAHIWATGPFTLSYGQNVEVSPLQAPAIDLGYVAIPGSDFVSLVLTTEKSANPQVIPTTSGSTSTFTISVNSQKYTVDAIKVLDILPLNWQYLGPTSITLPDMTTVSTAPTITAAGAALPVAFGGNCPAGGGPCLTWDSTVLGNMAENQQITITFTGQTTALLAAGTLSRNRVSSIGTRTFGIPSQTQTFTATDFAYVVTGDMGISKTTGAADPVYPGDTIPYTVTITNPVSAAGNLTGVSIYDPLPAGTSYVPSSGSVTCTRSNVNVRDEFASVAYNLNGPNNTANWASNWTETDINGTSGPTAGFVRINGGVLQFRYQTSTYIDNLDTGFYNLSNGTNPWDSSPWTETGDDGSATTGTIIVDGGGSNELRFGPGAVGRSVSRTAAVTGNSVTVNFTLSDRGIDAGEGVIAEYDIDGDAFGFREIQRNTNGTISFASSPVCTALPCTLNTAGATYITLRFRDFETAGNNTYEAGDFAGVDTVNITVPDAVGSNIQRTADLSGASSASLNFSYTSANLDTGGDYLVVEVSSSPAGPFNVLATFNAGTPDTAPPYDISTYISATTTIRFRITAGYNQTNEAFNIDNVDITYSGSGPFPSGNPPEFLSSSAGCQIAPGSSLTLTYSVTADDPFPSGQTTITNSASATSAEIPLALTASVTNWVVIPSVLSASSGGRIWLDADADGVADIGEPGFPNIEVTLKDQFGTPIATTLTDGNGRYLFTGVTPGTGYYVEVTDGLQSGLSQTYPYTSIPGDLSTNKSATFTLTDGQLYTSANIGYRSAAGSFGDQIWVDADSDGIFDLGEIGIGGVTVRLYSDNNGDGLIDGGDTLVSTATTAPDGTYLFTGVPASGTEDYIVSAITPSGYLPTGVSQYSYMNIATGSAYMNADFGFRGNTVTTYSITDRVWTDSNGDGSFSGENGIAGVTVELLDASLNVIGTTISAADGTFTFSGITGGGADYTVRINDTSGILIDYFGTTQYALDRERPESNVTGNLDRSLSPSFGFAPLRSVGDTIFNDLNGNGIQDSGEPGIAGVTVSLYRDTDSDGIIDVGETLIGSVTTDSNGQYLFSGLTDGDYIISVPVPSGYSFIPDGITNIDTDSGTTGIQNMASVSGGTSVLTKDFGFQAAIARTVSGTIWDDLDADGIIDGGESGIGGVTIDIISGSTVVATVTTTASGTYTVPGLASGTYTVRVTDTTEVLTDYNSTYEITGGTGGPFNYEEVVDLSGGDVSGVRFGFRRPSPTLITLSDFSAYNENNRIVIQWKTSSENNTAGFYLFRRDEKTGDYRQINSELLPALLYSQNGATYSLIDNGASLTEANTYLLLEVEGRGRKNAYGPFKIGAGEGNAAESHFSSEARSASALLGNNNKQALSGTKITRYIDREGTIVISNGSRSSHGKDKSAGSVSDYKISAAAVSSEKMASLAANEDAKAASAIARAQSTSGMLKIPVISNGLYLMESAKISSVLGITDSKVRQLIKSNKLALTNQGRSIAYIPASDYSGIFFYAEGMESIYTKENIYWLYSGNGVQMSWLNGGSPAPSGYGTFTETVHSEEDRYPAPALAETPESDYWFWDIFRTLNSTPDIKSFSIDLPGVADIPATASLMVKLHGLTSANDGDDHHAVISINGTPIGEVKWKGAAEQVLNINFSQGLLYSGTNTIEVAGLLDTGAPYSIFYLDSFDLTYHRLLEALDDSITFSPDSSSPLTVYGFTHPDIFVFDITRPERPVLINAATLTGSSGNYSVSFIPISGARYLATTPEAAYRILNARADSSSKLASAKNRANYIIITTSELSAAAKELAQYRQKQGHKTMVVDIEDIMDEFSYGIYDPEAIRSFLRYAYTNWKTKPGYVLFAGDGTYDYKNNMGIGDNLIPTLMTETPDYISPSDNIYADFDNDHVPDIAIGRIPVLTPAELRSVISKIIAYESSSNRHVVMLADNQDDGGNFPADSDLIAALIPAAYSQEKIYLSSYAPDQARQMLLNEINGGAMLLNYIGHAGVTQLANEGLLRIADMPALLNTGKPFILSTMTCSVGNFALPGYDSLSEALLTKDGAGAVAVFAPTGLSYNDQAVILNEHIFLNTFGQKGITIGNALIKAFKGYKSTGSPSFIMDIYNLQGDPALKLR